MPDDDSIAGIEAAVRATFANVDAWNDGYGRGYAAGMAAGRRPRDDEARIERAARAALDGILIALGWALDDVEYPKALNAARAALAAADQEEKP